MIAVDNTLYHIPEYSSHVVLPLVPAQEGMARVDPTPATTGLRGTGD